MALMAQARSQFPRDCAAVALGIWAGGWHQSAQRLYQMVTIPNGIINAEWVTDHNANATRLNRGRLVQVTPADPATGMAPVSRGWRP
jgi:hypothetical protein